MRTGGAGCLKRLNMSSRITRTGICGDVAIKFYILVWRKEIKVAPLL